MEEYLLIEEILRQSGENSTTYGIAVISKNKVIREIHDITLNKQNITRLIALCNSENLSPVHLDEVIDNFLYDGVNL